MPRPDPAPQLRPLLDGVTRVAEGLFHLDADPELQLLRSASSLRGRTAQVAAEVGARVDRLWLHYPVMKQAVDDIEAALAGNDRIRLSRLLAPGSVVAPDGARLSPMDLLRNLEGDLAATVTALREVGGVWRDLLRQVDEGSAELRRLDAEATAAGLGRLPEIDRARTAVDALAADVAVDPLGIRPERAQDAMSAVRAARVAAGGLLDERRSLGPRVEAARATLQELRQLIADGAEAAERTRSRISGTARTEPPLDVAIVDGDDPQALAPWLARLEALTVGDQWLSASKGLLVWQRVADGHVAQARHVVTVNAAPVRRRDELRGLVAAYQAKAAASGKVEDPAVATAIDEATSALHARPCDLQSAERLVRDVMDAVREATSR